MEQYTFEIWESNRRFTKSVNAKNRDLAWEKITMMYPNASYIDEF
jgi:hypothetical protein